MAIHDGRRKRNGGPPAPFPRHPRQPHDLLVKWAFSQARHAESLLRAAFPEAVSALLRWGTVQVEDTVHVNPALSVRHGDLVLSIGLRDAPGRLCALIEQQRTVEARMMLRIGDYMARTWQRLHRARAPGRLPPLVAILIYNGKRPWTEPTTFQELIGLPGAASGGAASRRSAANGDAPAPAAPHAGAAWLAQHTPHFSMHLVDLHNGRMDGIDESALTPLGRVVLWCLSVAGDDDLLERGIGRIAGSLSEVLREPDATDALEVLLRYLAATHPRIPEQRIRAIVENVAGLRAQEVIVSFLDEIENKGKQQGRKEGLLHGRREALLQLLARRFGPVPKDVQKRIEEAGVRELRRWTPRVLDAMTVEDVLGTSRPAARAQERGSG